ncbi:MAG: hypothetical protein HY698_12700 [Deltaproteobacteria bacterium]|nr:hypothetical protein [Deltaproteobacteria bacterium]
MRRDERAAFSPDPKNTVDVLAFVLCPATAFAPVRNQDELDAIRSIMLPVKTEAIRRWSKAQVAMTRC